MRKLTAILFAIGLITGIYSFSFCQEPNAPQDPALQESKPVLKVTAIEIKGNKAISSNTVISKMRTRVGSPYRENVVSDDLKRLYLLGFFSDIKIDSVDYNGGIKVVVSLEERPIIEKITFSGMKRVNMREEKLKGLLKSKEGQYLDYPDLSEDIREIKKLYDKIGYSDVAIDYRVNLAPETNKAAVEFSVVEGSKIAIKQILIEGNKVFSDGRIRKLMKTKSAWLFNAGVLKDDVLKDDMERIKSFYGREGYADAGVRYEIRPDKQKPNLLYVIVKVTEGKKYLVGNVTVSGAKQIKLKEVLAVITQCIPGKVFSQDGLKQDTAAIQGLYFDRGYVFAQVQEATSLNPDTGRTDISYYITENQVTYVDKIKIRGNVKTRDLVIRRELRIHPGDRFDGEKLRRSKERLQNLGFFDEISYDTENSPQPDKKNLVVEVKETKTGTFSFGGGYSTVDQFVGFVEVEQKNFDWKNFPYFTGAGQDIKFRAMIGSISNSFDISFTEPWLFDYPVAFGFDAYKRDHQRAEEVGYGYNEKVTGGDLRLGRELSEYVRGDIKYRFDNIDISDISDDASEALKKESGSNNVSSIALALSFDSRDNVFEARKGNLITGNIEDAGGFLGGDKNFVKFYGRASHYFPLPYNSVLEARGRIGMADPYGDSDELPIYERFFAGGAYTIRGYDERKVGPIDPDSKDPLGGGSMMVGNLEYTYPIFNFFKVAAFFDIGNVWAKMNEIGNGGFKSSVGLGLRVKTPIGPIMLDYGIPLDVEPGEDRRKSGKFHFSASQGF